MLPNAFSFALLGSIESLLSAVVADGMTGRRHRSNTELVAQGVANVGSGLFGGFCVTGTIARTATNVRAGAHGPVAGHRAFAVPARLRAGGGAARRLHPARRARRGPRGRRLGHGREAGDPGAARRLAGRRGGAPRDPRPDALPRPDRGDRRRLRARRGALHPPHGAAVAVEEAPRAPYQPDEGADPQAVVYRVTRRDVLRRGLGGRRGARPDRRRATGCWSSTSPASRWSIPPPPT